MLSLVSKQTPTHMDTQMSDFRSYLKTIRALIDTKIKENQDLINRMTFLTFSENHREVEDGIEVRKLATADQLKLLEVQQDTRCIYNATPHPIDMMDEITQEILCTIKPSGLVARMTNKGGKAVQDDVKTHCFVVAPVDVSGLYLPIIKTKVTYKEPFDVVVDLPPYEEGVYYIVSAMVFMAIPERGDLLQVDPVRNELGHTIGAKGFITHK